MTTYQPHPAQYKRIWNGTDKQNAYANDLRDKFIAEAQAFFAGQESRAEAAGQLEGLRLVGSRTIELIAEQNDYRYWIDTRLDLRTQMQPYFAAAVAEVKATHEALGLPLPAGVR